MKQLTLAFFIAALILATSCNKVGSGNAASWSFEGSSYNATTTSTIRGTLSSTSTNGGTQTSVLSVAFPGDTLPKASATYSVHGDSAVAKGQVGITLSTNNGANQYWATAGNYGFNQSVDVTVSGGKVSITGQGIEIKNVFPASDSAVLNFNITQ